MIIDCDTCEVRGAACGDCVIGVLMDTPEVDRPVPYLPVDPAGSRSVPAHAAEPTRVTEPTYAAEPTRLTEPMYLAEPERRALEVLADQGLIPRLRLVPLRPAAHRTEPGYVRDAG